MKRHRRYLLAALVIGTVGGAQTACYQRVVRTKGYAVRTREVYEANLGNEPDLVDRRGRPKSKTRK